MLRVLNILLWLGVSSFYDAVISTESVCRPTVTTTSGTHAPGHFCSGDLIFSEDFNKLDFEKWQHENTLSGGGNWEFQWYTNNRTNSFAEKGFLHIRPSLTADQFGDAFLSSGTLNVQGGSPADQCTNPKYWGCERAGTASNIVNPIKSTSIRTVNSFSFAFGKVEVRAKMPAGDWLWPAIWLMPAHNVYGTWPASGEIDLVESRGNRKLIVNNVNIGVEQVGSTLHYGPSPELDSYEGTHWNKTLKGGYDKEFHRYFIEWRPDYIRFCIDDVKLGKVLPGEGGFWELGKFSTRLSNPWKYGSKMAPFDEKFYLIINLAVGGTAFFPDNAENPKKKPWSNQSPTAVTDFWKRREDWLPTWNLDSESADLQIDYVRVWAL